MSFSLFQFDDEQQSTVMQNEINANKKSKRHEEIYFCFLNSDLQGVKKRQGRNPTLMTTMTSDLTFQ